MLNILLFIHLLVCFALIGLVLLQRGKGADIGAAFGSGSSNTIFGSQGAGDFLSTLTAWLAAAFFVLALTMTYITNTQLKEVGILNSPLPATSGESGTAPSFPIIPG